MPLVSAGYEDLKGAIMRLPTTKLRFQAPSAAQWGQELAPLLGVETSTWQDTEDMLKVKQEVPWWHESEVLSWGNFVGCFVPQTVGGLEHEFESGTSTHGF